MTELSWRIALERKEILSGIRPQTLWYNRINKVLFCWLQHKYRILDRRPLGYMNIVAVSKECVRCGNSFEEHIVVESAALSDR